MRWLVDAMNVIGSRPDGWWRDREGAGCALLADLESFARRAGDEVTAVFDGRPFELPPTRSVEVVFAPSADDAIVENLSADAHPGTVTVVTSDAELAARARAAGALVTGAGGFRRRLDEATR
ncbi:MAG: NYN domain-containing protein [Solirubrobacteraceae bacterium]